jgi:hypothetical protein
MSGTDLLAEIMTLEGHGHEYDAATQTFLRREPGTCPLVEIDAERLLPVPKMGVERPGIALEEVRSDPNNYIAVQRTKILNCPPRQNRTAVTIEHDVDCDGRPINIVLKEATDHCLAAVGMQSVAQHEYDLSSTSGEPVRLEGMSTTFEFERPRPRAR